MTSMCFPSPRNHRGPPTLERPDIGLLYVELTTEPANQDAHAHGTTVAGTAQQCGAGQAEAQVGVVGVKGAGHCSASASVPWHQPSPRSSHVPRPRATTPAKKRGLASGLVHAIPQERASPRVLGHALPMQQPH
ncbi:hypothetical protein PSPO01_07279 [Paraphaeosphaeria sporulosa]